jgi:hypothetical protein
MERKLIVNGKAIIVREGATGEEVVGSLDPHFRDDDLLEIGPAGESRIVGQKEPVDTGKRYQTIPKIVKGSPPDRIDGEIDLLRKQIRGSEIKRGKKSLGTAVYHAVLIKRVRLSNQKFNVSFTDLLFLLPPAYPRHPPIGCYLNFRWPTIDHHFTLRSYYGAPDLQSEGWYWYCVGLAGIRKEVVEVQWKPAALPEDGHNLASLFFAAQRAINTDKL